MTANLRGLRKFFRTRIFSRQDAKAQSSENVSFLRVFAPLREIISALVAALPLWELRGLLSRSEPFDYAQDMLCTSAGDIPKFGCASAALSSLRSNYPPASA